MQRILHVERSAFFQKIIGDILHFGGFEHQTCISIHDALEIIATWQPDLLICSLELEDGKGQELIKIINHRPEAIPIIVITATESLEIRQELFALGVADYLVKADISKENLLAYIQRIIDPDPLLDTIKGLRFAALDDSPLALQIISSIFTMYGLPNLQLFSTSQALLQSDLKFDMILLDLMLPDGKGENIIQTIRQSHPDMMIVAVSGIAHSKTISRILDAGADDYLTKPFDAPLLMARIKSTVRSWLLLKESRLHHDHLARLARQDSLTGILNHKAILEEMTDCSSCTMTESHQKCGILLVDIDDFKKLNDQYGHQTGDEVLLALVAHCQKHFGQQMTMGRYGGEEFLLLFRTMESAEKVRRSCNELLKTFLAQKLTPHQLTVSFSGGLIFYGSNTAIKAFALADQALYQAKARGKAQIVELAMD